MAFVNYEEKCVFKMITFLITSKKSDNSTTEYLTGTSVQPLAKSLSTTMGHFTKTSPSSARMTRLGRQQLFPTSATVGCPNLCTVRSFLGSKCVNPPQPDSSQKLIVSWNPEYPPAHDEKITYKCNAGQPYNRQDLVYTHIPSNNSYNQVCI